MPIYSFRCDACSHEFDFLMKPYDPVACPKCQANSATKLVTTASYKWNAGDEGGSTHPKRVKEGKRD